MTRSRHGIGGRHLSGNRRQHGSVDGSGELGERLGEIPDDLAKCRMPGERNPRRAATAIRLGKRIHQLAAIETRSKRNGDLRGRAPPARRAASGDDGGGDRDGRPHRRSEGSAATRRTDETWTATWSWGGCRWQGADVGVSGAAPPAATTSRGGRHRPTARRRRQSSSRRPAERTGRLQAALGSGNGASGSLNTGGRVATRQLTSRHSPYGTATRNSDGPLAEDLDPHPEAEKRSAASPPELRPWPALRA